MPAETLMEIPNEWIVGIAGAFVALCGAIWGYIKSQHKTIITRMDNQATRVEGKLDKCEERHVERDKESLLIAERLGRLEGAEDVAKRIENATRELIKEVRKDDT